MSTSRPGSELENGIPFCRIKSWLTGRRLVSLPFSDHCEPLVNNAKEFNAIAIRMTRCVEQGRERYVELRPLHYLPEASAVLGVGATYQFHSIDLRPSWTQLVAAVSTKIVCAGKFDGPRKRTTALRRGQQTSPCCGTFTACK